MIIALLLLCGIATGVLSALLGVGGGMIMVPILISTGLPYQGATAASSIAIIIISVSGTIKNLRDREISLKDILVMAIPAMGTAYLGAIMVKHIPKFLLELSFGLLLISTLFLRKIQSQTHGTLDEQENPDKSFNNTFLLSITGGSGGLLAGLFGVGGGIVMVPMQLVLLRMPIKTAVRNSLGVIAISSVAAAIGHGIAHGPILQTGMLLGVGGIIGAQIGLFYLPKFNDRSIHRLLNSLVLLLAIYFFWIAFRDFPN